MIERTQTNNILSLLKSNPIVGIIGSRQSGKTTIAKKILKSLNNKGIILDLENPADYQKLQSPLLFLKDFENVCVIIDEIQKIPELFEVLRYMIDQKRKPSRFLILGSANPKLIKGVNESLAGRISFVEVSPFNFTEISKKIKWKKHWFLGGYPNSILKKKTADSFQWIDDYVFSLLERDLPSYGLTTSTQTLSRFFSMLAYSQGSILNASDYSRSLEISQPVIMKYIDFLENAFIIRRLYPFIINIRKRLIKSPKVYIRDSGILHRLLRISNVETLMGNPVLGSSWEGYVIEQIFQIKNKNIDMFFYRTKNGAECDVVFSKAYKPVTCAEIKFSSTPNIQKSLKITMDDLSIRNGYIITPESDDYPISKNVRACNLETFLNKYLPDIN